MKTIYAKHEPYLDGHLQKVADEMDLAGPPTIRCVQRDPGSDVYFALEGSHRIAICHRRGIEPKIVLEQKEGDESLDAFWDRVAPTLPRYDFEAVHVLDMEVFVFSRNPREHAQARSRG